MGDGGAAAVLGQAGDEQLEGAHLLAQGADGLVLVAEAAHRRGQRGVRQVQGEGVGVAAAAGVEQQDAEPLGGDLGVHDAALELVGGGRVGGAVLQPGLDHQGALVQPCGVLAQVGDGAVEVVGRGLQHLALGGDELHGAGPERLPQPAQGPLGGLGHERESGQRAARERDGQGEAEAGQVGGVACTNSETKYTWKLIMPIAV